MHGIHRGAVGLELLFLVRQVAPPVHEQELGAEQADAHRARRQRGAGVLGHLDIGEQLDLEPVQRHRRGMAQPLQALLLQRALALPVAVFLEDDGGRVDDHQPGIAVDDDPVVLADQLARALHPHRGRDIQAARDDGGVRGAPAKVGDKAVEHGVAELQHVGRGDVVGHHDHARRRLAVRGQCRHRRRHQHGGAGQRLQDALDHLPDIGLALAQVFVLDLVELAHQFLEPRGECPLSVVAAAPDQRLGLARERLVVEDHRMHVEEGAHLFGRVARQVALERRQLSAHRGAGGAQPFHLGIELVFIDQVVRHVQRRGREQVRAPDGDAARDRDAVQGEWHVPLRQERLRI
ncbi:hypothetical protein D9M69_436240 [compost metagenome]